LLGCLLCKNLAMEDPLVANEGGSGRARGKYDKSCLFPSVIAAVLGVAFLGCLIGLIVVAATSSKECECKPDSSLASSYNPSPVVSSSSSPSPQPSSSSSSSAPTTFTKYTAKALVRKSTSDSSHVTNWVTFTQYSWGEGKYAQEQLNENGDVFLREFATENDGSVTVCQQIGDHGNCYRQSGGSSLAFSVDGMNLIMQGVPCDQLLAGYLPLIPERHLDKCDFYTTVTPVLPGQNQDVILQVVTESGTNLPVFQDIKSYDAANSIILLISSFEPGEPQDESKLQPFPGVRIYDFRNGEGNCTEEVAFRTKKYDNNDMFMNTLAMQQKMNKILNLPLKLVSEVNPVYVRRTTLRDPRDIPAEFDARTQWPDCAEIISTIVNQDRCGSCWAMSSSSVTSDRLCISKGEKLRLSPQWMVYCGTNTSGCQGAFTAPTWEQLRIQGVVSEDCVPFTGHDGRCPEYCSNYTEIKSVRRVRVDGYVLPWGDTDETRVQAIQTEIMTNGPVQASFLAFDDWKQYNGGVYHRARTAVLKGGHAVRIIGWGSENGDDYWLVANSYGANWGDNGYFKIHRGNNECNIEEEIAAGFFN